MATETATMARSAGIQFAPGLSAGRLNQPPVIMLPVPQSVQRVAEGASRAASITRAKAAALEEGTKKGLSRGLAQGRKYAEEQVETLQKELTRENLIHEGSMYAHALLFAGIDAMSDGWTTEGGDTLPSFTFVPSGPIGVLERIAAVFVPAEYSGTRAALKGGGQLGISLTIYLTGRQTIDAARSELGT